MTNQWEFGKSKEQLGCRGRVSKATRAPSSGGFTKLPQHCNARRPGGISWHKYKLIKVLVLSLKRQIWNCEKKTYLRVITLVAASPAFLQNDLHQTKDVWGCGNTPTNWKLLRWVLQFSEIVKIAHDNNVKKLLSSEISVAPSASAPHWSSISIYEEACIVFTLEVASPELQALCSPIWPVPDKSISECVLASILEHFAASILVHFVASILTITNSHFRQSNHYDHRLFTCLQITKNIPLCQCSPVSCFNVKMFPCFNMFPFVNFHLF